MDVNQSISRMMAGSSKVRARVSSSSLTQMCMKDYRHNGDRSGSSYRGRFRVFWCSSPRSLPAACWRTVRGANCWATQTQKSGRISEEAKQRMYRALSILSCRLDETSSFIIFSNRWRTTRRNLKQTKKPHVCR